MRDIEKEIAETEARLRALKLEYAQSQQPLNGIAADLHAVLCRANHIDGCSWEKEREGFDSGAHSKHAQFFRIAERLAQEIGTDVAVRAVKVLLASR